MSRSFTGQLPTKSVGQVIDEICEKLRQERHKKGPAYALIVGAGFSCPIVPLTKTLLHEEIGDYYFTGRHEPREVEEKIELSADFWKEFNAAGSKHKKPLVKLDDEGLPADCTAAYQLLFTYRQANKLFAATANALSRSFAAGLRQQRGVAKADPGPRVLGGETFVKDFLRYVLDPAGTPRSDVRGWENDDYTSGRNNLNGAHFFLASLLELQQTGRLSQLRPFCRTLFTTNFDTMLQDALQLVNVLYRLTDRPERGLDVSDFPEDDPVIHLVYTHGSILRHNPASTDAELRALSEKNAKILKTYLQQRDIIVLGYGGWPDSLMSALADVASDHAEHQLYWCDRKDLAEEKLAPTVVQLIKKAAGHASYVCLGSDGAGGFMARLVEALASADDVPGLLRDPVRAYLDRLRRVTLGDVTLKCFKGGGQFAPARESAAGVPADQILRATLNRLEQAAEPERSK